MGIPIPQQQPLTPEQAYALLNTWYADKQQLAVLRAKEILERKQVVGHYVPAANEGTNRVDLGGGYDLVVKQSFNRKVDEAALENVKASQAKKLKLNLDLLFPMKPSLSLTEYRKLTDEQRLFVDSLLTIEEGSPQVDIVQQSDEATRARAAEHKAAAAPPPPPAPAVEFVVVENAEDAQPGNYYTDGADNWWQLTDAYEWEEVADPHPTTPAVPAKAPRKSAAKKATKKATKR